MDDNYLGAPAASRHRAFVGFADRAGKPSRPSGLQSHGARIEG
jgi:hypothetical protein